MGEHNWGYAYSLKEGDVVIEVGAYTGDDVAAFSQAVGITGRVILIEPNPALFIALRNAAALDTYNNVTLVFKAVYSSNGLVSFTGGAHEQGHLSYVPPFRGQSDEGRPVFDVEAITLDTLASTLGLAVINLLVMDVEGAEMDVFVGAYELFKKGVIKNIATAAYHQAGDIERFEALLRLRGFNKFVVDEKNSNNTPDMPVLHASLE